MLTIGIDIGGTFTDVVGVRDGAEVFAAKVPSTPGDLVRGVSDGVRKILALAGEGGDGVHRFIHGTTVATNALLEERGARLGIITTAGFEDVLEIGRQLRPRDQLYRLDTPPQTPVFLAPRDRRFGVRERIDSEGAVLELLDEAEVLEAARTLIEDEHVEAIAICFLFSFLNPTHEQRARELIAGQYPELEVSVSSAIDPVIREYERLCVTCTDAYIRPVVRRYLSELEEGLRELGIEAALQVMQSRGAISGVRNALRTPVSLVASGPAAGVLGAIDAAAQCGYDSLVTIDIGGTSSDVALVTDGQAMITRGGIIRGFPLRMATVDVNSIGAGGGSIAWLDSAGGLRVGPRSAGAAPGPVCYGRGGTEPTVTDASVVLGYLNPDYFAGGEFSLDVEKAVDAISAIGEQLGLGTTETALGIHRVVNANMADQIRLRSVGRGHDPRRFALVVLGGAGAVHGASVADDLAIPVIVVPRSPGVLSAYGLLVSSIEHERLATFIVRTDQVTSDAVNERLRDLQEQAMELMMDEGVVAAQVAVSRSADMRYVGQSFELDVPLAAEGDPDLVHMAQEAFFTIHEQVYRHMSREAPVEFVNLRVTVKYPLPHPHSSGALKPSRAQPQPAATRTVYFPGCSEGLPTPIYDRSVLRPGMTVPVPAVIEQPDTTTVVPPGWEVAVQPRGELLMTRAEA